MKLHYYIVIGLLLWGLPSVLVAGPEMLGLVVSAALPVWIAGWRAQNSDRNQIGGNHTFPVGLLVATVVLYLLFDAWIGRQKFAQNLFLSPAALDSTIESINENVSRGRGIVELLGALCIFIPFALFDLARDAHPLSRVVLRVLGGVLIFYEIGISRGYALMAVAAIALGGGVSAFRFAWATGISLGVFVVSSFIRGDFNEVAFSNPLFDAVAWPFVNLGLLMNADCGNGTWLQFVGEFFKKLLPSFMVRKDVLSFNVEMTQCVYPSFTAYVESVSIFTYLGEFQYYTPSLVTALIAGLMLAVLCHFVDAMLVRHRLISTRVFTGLMCIVLLRSRVLDVASVLIFLLIFMVLWRAAQRSTERTQSVALQSARWCSEDESSSHHRR